MCTKVLLFFSLEVLVQITTIPVLGLSDTCISWSKAFLFGQIGLGKPQNEMLLQPFHAGSPQRLGVPLTYRVKETRERHMEGGMEGYESPAWLMVEADAKGCGIWASRVGTKRKLVSHLLTAYKYLLSLKSLSPRSSLALLPFLLHSCQPAFASRPI